MRLPRRTFLANTAAAAAIAPLAAWAQDRLPVVGSFCVTTKELMAPLLAALRATLKALGYADGEIIVIVESYADGEDARLPSLAAEMVALAPDVIVTGSAPGAAAVRDVTQTIPIVLHVGFTTDYLDMGLIEAVARPGGNVTGVTTSTVDSKTRMMKKMEIAHDMVPDARRIGILLTEDNPRGGTYMEGAQEAAALLGVEAVLVPFRSAADFDAVFQAMARDGIGVVVAEHDLNILNNGAAIVAAANAAGMPVLYQNRSGLEDGLAHYSPNRTRMMRRAADYVVRILEGADPAEMPVEIMLPELRINLQAAARIGFTFPPILLVRADEVIE